MTRRRIIQSFVLFMLALFVWKWKGIFSWTRKLFADPISPGAPAAYLPRFLYGKTKLKARPLLFQFKVKGKAPTSGIIKLMNQKKVIFYQNVLFNKKTETDLYPQVKYLKEQDISVITLAISPEYASYPHLKVDVTNLTVLDQRILPQQETHMVTNKHNIEGYATKINYEPGETIEFKVHTLKKEFHISISRYGMQDEVLYKKMGVKGMVQNYPAYAYREGCNWQTSHRFTIPNQWKSGLYSARIWDDDGREFYITWIIRPKKLGRPVSTDEKKKRIAILASTNTWHAYNPWGGASTYRYKANPKYQADLPDQIAPKFAQFVSTQRPNLESRPVSGNGPSHLASGEKYVCAWFERENIPYDLYSDLDLHENPNLLDSYGTVCIQTHSEYWTKEMYDHLEAFMNRGGNLLYLSGNGVYWKTVIERDLLEIRKDGEIHTITGEKGGKWRDLNRPESRLLGVCYTSSGIGTFAPYRVMYPNHWIFEGTGVKKGDIIGKDGLRGGASGHETDKRNKFSPKNLVLLAKGLNPNNDPLQEDDGSLPVSTEKGMEVGKGGGEIVYYDHEKGGGVFSVGSITYGTSMWVDPVLSKMLRNVIKRFTGM